MSNHIKEATIEEKLIIHNLIQPYMDELSKFPDDSPDYKDEDDIYHYPYLDDYWLEDTRYPYLLFRDNKIAGFALVSYYDSYWRMAEIFVLPEFRQNRVAFDCSSEIFREHPGIWKISFNKRNFPSQSLWQKLADNLSKGTISAGQSTSSHDYIMFCMGSECQWWTTTYTSGITRDDCHPIMDCALTIIAMSKKNRGLKGGRHASNYLRVDWLGRHRAGQAAAHAACSHRAGARQQIHGSHLLPEV